MPKVKVTIRSEIKLCLKSCCSYITEANLMKPKVSIRGLQGHLLHTVTFFVYFYLSKKIRLDFPCESSA